MAKIFITGSADGLGKLSARKLISQGHEVVLHARNNARAQELAASVPEAKEILIADLSSIEQTIALAGKANKTATFDAVIHNAGVYQVDRNAVGLEGISVLFAVNSLAPYILTSLMAKPKRLIYLSSDMHLQGSSDLSHVLTDLDKTGSSFSYSDTKLHDLILSMAVARKWPGVCANAVDPGWVPTKMGGRGAPGNLQQGFESQIWLAVSEDRTVLSSGSYYHHKKKAKYLETAKNPAVQENLLEICRKISGVSFPT